MALFPMLFHRDGYVRPPGYRRQEEKKRFLLIALVLFVAACFAALTILLLLHMPKKSALPPDPILTVISAAQPLEGGDEPALLALPAEYTGEEPVFVDARCYDALCELLDAAEKDGCVPRVLLGYTDAETQRTRFLDTAAQLRASGQFPASELHAQTRKFCGDASTDEHRLGLCVTFGTKEDADDLRDTVFGKFLTDHAADYGFILRYPEGKEAITGRVSSPAEFRFVGKDAAKAMRKHDLTLEEYLADTTKDV